MPSRSPHDPLDAVLRPPPDESPAEKAFRIAQEAEARRVSAAIDESIRQERAAHRRAKVVRLLLLGQSESGKSTTLRQFQRLYTPSTFREDRALWRAVVQLNLVRSVSLILDALRAARPADVPAHPHPQPQAHAHAHTHQASTSVSFAPAPGPSREPSSPTSSSVAASASSAPSYPGSDYAVRPSADYTAHPDAPPTILPPHLATLVARLAPLRHVEALLVAALSPAHAAADRYERSEMSVRPGSALKRAMRCVSGVDAASPSPSPSISISISGNGNGKEKQRARASGGEADAAQAALHACSGDLLALWRDPLAREILRRRRVRVEEGPGFFLDDLERITGPRYMPSDDDVLKARLKTVGVSEYRFEMEAGSESGTQWRIIDVGGSRSQRQTWVPFFDDVNAIIFLAPISCFDQTLAEDKTVNRLEDSVLLWKALCANKLLARVDIVLFLNKCDILAAKLASGVRLVKYVRNFGDRANEPDVVEKYFRSKFTAIHREYSPVPRKFYGFCTSVTDSTTTGGIIASVRDMVVREHLRASKLL